MNRFFFVGVVCLAVVTAPLMQCTNETPARSALTFYVMGDWGRMGSPDQIAVADQMELWTRREDPRFLVTTGDNFYPIGVSSTTDRHWQDSFEKVYDGTNLKRKPWYVALGNHDYLGNPDAEIAYHNKNPRWNMPNRYYTRIERGGDGGSARLIFVDTSPFDSDARGIESVSTQDTLKQKVWLDSVCARKDTDWVMVVGHHHIYTGGARKDQVNSVRKSLEPIFEKNGVDIYFCGHEHDLQHLKAAGKPTHYFLSGAGSELRPTGTMEHSLFAASTQGFMSVTVMKKSVDVKVIDREGNVLYSTTLAH